MTAVQIEEADRADGARRAARSAGVAEWISGAVLVALGFVMLASETVIREWETRLATSIAGATFASDTMFAWSDGTPTVGFTMGEGWFAAQATVLTGAGYLAGAVALIGGALVLLRQISWPRALTITGIGVVAILVLNQLRLMLVLYTMGNTAQQGAHPLDDALGVVAMIIAFAGVLTLFFFAVKAARNPARQA